MGMNTSGSERFDRLMEDIYEYCYYEYRGQPTCFRELVLGIGVTSFHRNLRNGELHNSKNLKTGNFELGCIYKGDVARNGRVLERWLS